MQVTKLRKQISLFFSKRMSLLKRRVKKRSELGGRAAIVAAFFCDDYFCRKVLEQNGIVRLKNRQLMIVLMLNLVF